MQVVSISQVLYNIYTVQVAIIYIEITCMYVCMYNTNYNIIRTLLPGPRLVSKTVMNEWQHVYMQGR